MKETYERYDGEAPPPTSGEGQARTQAVERIQRKRRFHVELVVTAIGVVILIAICPTGNTTMRAAGRPRDSVRATSKRSSS
jgi:hypothetical protein